VVVYDARHATVTPSNAALLGATEIRLHILPAGSGFDPKRGAGSLPRP
jgi:cyanophycinase